MPKIKLFLFSTFTLSGIEPYPIFPTERSRALLAYLALHPHQPQSRKAIAELLWDDRIGNDSLANLRTELNRLRLALGSFAPLLLSSDRNTITFVGDDVTVDAVQCRSLILQCQQHEHINMDECPTCIQKLAQAVEMYRGPFLQGLHIGSNLAFEEWLLAQQERFQQLIMMALDWLIQYHQRHRQWDAVIRYARQQLTLAPWLESSYGTLIRAYYLAGERSQALSQYDTLVRQLAKELDVPPSAELQHLYEQVRSGAAISTRIDLPIANPYRGLKAFEQKHTRHFFGREKITSQIVEKLAKEPLLLLIGASGSGKSSLLSAGLMPRITQGHEGVGRGERSQRHVITFRPTAHPFAALAEALQDFIPLADTSLVDELMSGKIDLNDLVRMVVLPASHPCSFGGSEKLLIIIDQFEEIFSLCQDVTMRQHFLAFLMQTAASQSAHVSVLLAMRSDFLGQLLLLDGVADVVGRNLLVLRAMSPAEMTDAVERPAQMHNVHFEPGLVQRLLDDVGDDAGRLPLLQFTLTRLWQEQKDGWITHAAYEEMEGLSGALNHYANGILARLHPDQQRLAKRVLLRLVQVMEGVEDCRRVGWRYEFSDAEWAVVQILVAARLLVTDFEKNHEECVELVHEALIHDWHRLRDWLQADRDARLWQGRVRIQAQQWERSGKDEGALLRGALLTEAERWLDERREDLSVLTIEFVEASRVQRLHREAEQIAQRREKESQTRLVEARHLSAQAIRYATKRPDLAALLSLEAMQRMENPADQIDLFSSFYLEPRLITFLHRGERSINGLAYSCDGSYLLMIDDQAAAIRLDLEPQAETCRFDMPALSAVSFSNDGRYVSLSSKYDMQLWNVRTEERITVWNSPIPIRRHFFSGDGERLFIEHGGTASVFNTQDGLHIDTLPLPAGTIMVAVDGPGCTIVVAEISVVVSTLYLVDVASAQVVSAPMMGHTDSLQSVRVSPNGALIASASIDGSVRLWDARTGAPVGEPLIVRGCRMLELAFSPDSTLLASSGTNNQIFVWDVTTNVQITQPLIGHNNWVRGLAFHPDGRTLASSDIDGMVIIWNVGKSFVLTGHKQRVRDLALSPDGQTLVTTSFDRHIQIWNTDSLSLQKRISTPHQDAIMCTAFSPDGQFLATCDASGCVVFWDTQAWMPVGQPRIYQKAVLICLAFSPDSQWLAVGDFGGNIILHNLHHREAMQAWQAFENSWTMSLAFSLDGSRLSAGNSMGDILLYHEPLSHVAEDKPELLLSAWRGHTNWVTDLTFTPDGEQLVSSSSDGSIRAWDAFTGQALGEALIGHSHQVWQVVFDQSYPELTLVSLDNQGNVSWWNWKKRTLDRPILRTGIETECMALSREGSTLYLGTFDTTARVWPVEKQPWRERVCGLARRNLTYEEWKQFLPNVPYNATCPQWPSLADSGAR